MIKKLRENSILLINKSKLKVFFGFLIKEKKFNIFNFLFGLMPRLLSIII